MGSFIEINDTLRITKEQGFPAELDIEEHLKNPYSFELIKDKKFSFHAKPAIRLYKVPPVRNFLAEDYNGKWIYWGLCYITEIVHDYEKKETSGTFKIVQLYSPKEMKQMFHLTHFINKEQNYFNS